MENSSLTLCSSLPGETSSSSTKPKPDPPAPKITRPCTECGKKFWSWKALFGHMRCHPERRWRGINPPPNFRPPRTDKKTVSSQEFLSVITAEDLEVAACLLMLANNNQETTPDYNPARFRCTSCKRVFSSHQALGGHRASHKNVKGCYANTKNDGVEGEIWCSQLEHKCSVCLRVFSSGQALGGYMRCHCEKEEQLSTRVCGFDLNLDAAVDDDAFSYNSTLALDLRLGL